MPFLPALAMPPWALPFAAAARAVLAWLREIRVTVNGVMIASLIAIMALGGWWIARSARADERADMAAARKAATDELRADLDVLIAARSGRIAASDDRLRAISGELRALVAQIPAEVRTETRTAVVAGPQVLVPVIGPTKVVPAPVKAGGCDYTPEIRDTINRINVGGLK